MQKNKVSDSMFLDPLVHMPLFVRYNQRIAVQAELEPSSIILPSSARLGSNPKITCSARVGSARELTRTELK